jgi:hypothetical protein
METRQRTQPVSNSVVGSAIATVPRALTAKPRGPPASDAATAGHSLPRAPRKKARPKRPLRPRHNEHQTRTESLSELQLATLLVSGELA